MNTQQRNDYNHIDILIAEDSPTQADQLKYMLEQHHFHAFVANNGNKALALMDHRKPTLVISDIVMPEMDGYELCRAIKADKKFQDIPVILLTSLSGPEDVINGLKCGADNFIRKPLDERLLIGRIQYILANREVRRSEKMHIGVELLIGGEKHYITAERQQILDLLISTYDEAVHLNEDLIRREKQLDRANKILKGIYRIAKGLNSATTEHQVVELVLERALELPDVRAGWISLREGESEFRLAGSRGLPPALEVPGAMEGDCLCRRKALAGEIDRSMNITECERLQRSKGDTQGLRSHVTVPLRCGNTLLGILNLVGSNHVLFDDDDLAVLNGIGNQIAAALDRCRMHQHLEYLVQERTAELTAEIAERKRVEESLRNAEARYRALFEQSPDGVLLIDLETGKAIEANETAYKQLGYTRDEFDALRISDYEALEKPEETAKHMQKVIREGSDDFETLHRTKSGEIRNVHVWAKTIQLGGRVLFHAIFQDVTERERAEDVRKNLEAQLIQAQKLESLGTLASGIAHDFNNILGIIIGHATLVQRPQLEPDKIADSIKTITTAAQRGAALVRQLLTFARKSDVILQRISLNDLIKEVVSLTRETFPKTVTVSMKLADKLPTILADSTQIHQVFLNLCVNARDAMPNGGNLNLSTRLITGENVHARFSDAKASEYVLIEVSDTGTGMDETTRNRIFEPFFTTKAPGKGTGLGLAVAFGIIHIHQGFIDVSSEPGHGTTFSIYFPVNLEELEPFEIKKEMLADTEGGTETIFLVEDEEMLRSLTKMVLKGKGYNVVTASDGEEAVRMFMLRQNDIDLVLCDMGLPKLNGYDVLKQVKRINPAVKFIIASGYIEPTEKSEILKSGARDFIQKPYVPNEMLRKIREVLDEDSDEGREK